MKEDKKAKLLLLGEEFLDTDDLLEGVVNSTNINRSEHFYPREDTFFMTATEEYSKRPIKITLSVDFYGDYNKLKNLPLAKGIKVVLLDEFGNIIG